ncbi:MULTISPECIES: phage minor head protein [Methylococcus]|uniref:Phage head morphogenesis protein n=1 Tax=Methylococcus capsulatus TaxID=414 RepID=A0ABZ2F9E0_METCP|nr:MULTISPECIES: phage minor head protein [Methylococcus]
MSGQYGSLPFDEAIRFFRGKDLVPTDRWADVWKEEHDVGFMVAGAAKADLLADLHGAVLKGVSKGTTLAEFRKDFDAIVARHGWTGWKGEATAAGRAWRTRLIYDTNLRTAYQAGRWAQVQAGKQWRPYLEYKHSDLSAHPRPLHVSWDGLVMAVDDPWVQTHWPPNGWGCKCRMFALAERDLRRMGKTGPDTPPDDGSYDWTDKVTGEVHRVPNGIDPGWDYAPGASRTDLMRKEIERKVAKLPAGIGRQLKEEVLSPRITSKDLDELIRLGNLKTDALIGKAGTASEDFRAALREVLQTEVGTQTAAAVTPYGSNGSKAKRLLEEASRQFPDSWTRKADAFGKLYGRYSEARALHMTLIGDYRGQMLDLKRQGFGVMPGDVNAGYIRCHDPFSAVHELAHRLQSAMPELDGLFQALHRRRTNGDPLRRLKDLKPDLAYGRDERAREDHYIDPYFGKEYDGRGALEVLTMAFETVLAPRDAVSFTRLLVRDRELFNLVIGVLFHYVP